MQSRDAALHAVPGAVAAGPIAATVSQLMQDARDLLPHDRRAAALTLLRASRLLDAPVAGPTTVAASVPVVVPGGLARWQMIRLTDYVEAHLDQPIVQKALASQIRLSSGHFARAFKQSFGRTAHTYVMERRIERAKGLMLRTSAPLCEIALACGLSDQAHFSRVFRRIAGSTPLAWRRQHQPAPGRRAGEEPRR
ncbi:helix-turn-helix domain-containing protein [Roseomonas sp. KE2513]|uniref:helix-turn-helix domain-containing protein n=1 Tax=Roseomonas sp. KE2513 TaxID=2479202 RepID=UPI0018DF3E52|nr:AraC family transcriptional regulator [Roseomonas sp. KE2513]